MLSYTKKNSRGSSVVERSPEEAGVGCSIHPRGTTKQKIGLFLLDRFFVYILKLNYNVCAPGGNRTSITTLEESCSIH